MDMHQYAKPKLENVSTVGNRQLASIVKFVSMGGLENQRK